MKTGIELITEERQEQIEKHKFDDDNDRDHTFEELKNGALYALTLEHDFYPKTWAFWFHDNLKKKEERYENRRISRDKI